MSRVRFWQNTGAKGAFRIRKELQARGVSCLRMRQNNSRFRGNYRDIIINWGSQRSIPESYAGRALVLNDPSRIYGASNKLATFKRISAAVGDGFTVPWTEDVQVAEQWAEEGALVYCRTRLSSSKGRGIVVAHDRNELVPAPLYTKGVPFTRECRLHVFGQEVIDFTQKKRMSSERLEEEGIAEANEEIRNHTNGFIFARGGVEIPDVAREAAVTAVSALGLNFASVDLLVNDETNEAYVLEVNTASGMEGTTVERYADAIEELTINR